MSRGLVVALAAALVLVCVASSGAARTAQSYADPQGDQQGNAPDVTTVVVSNDAAGNIRWRINVANQPTLLPDSAIVLFIDSDRNPGTGAPDTLGAEYVFGVAADGYSFGHWTGTDFDFDTPFTTVTVAYNAGPTITVNRSELGNTSGFNFWVRGVQEIDEETSNIDDAPNDGTYRYALTPLAPRHGVVGARSMTKVQGGLRASFTFRVQPVTGSRVQVVFRVNGKHFAQRGFPPTARTVTLIALGLGKGVYTAQLRVRAPGAPWRTLATVRRRL